MNQVLILSLENFEIVDRIQFQGSPQGIDLSLDGTRLFVALRGAGAVAGGRRRAGRRPCRNCSSTAQKARR